MAVFAALGVFFVVFGAFGVVTGLVALARRDTFAHRAVRGRADPAGRTALSFLLVPTSVVLVLIGLFLLVMGG